MKMLTPTILALALTMMVSSTALGGNIGGLRTAGNIAGLRSSGNIGGTRAAGIATQGSVSTTDPRTSRFDFEAEFSGTFAGLIRMLLESGALL